MMKKEDFYDEKGGFSTEIRLNGRHLCIYKSARELSHSPVYRRHGRRTPGANATHSR